MANKLPRGTTSYSGVLFAEADAENIGWIQVAMVGKWEHEFYGTIEITKAHLKEFVRNFEEGKRDVVVDYQHSSHSPDPEEAIAGGWVKELTIKNRGKELWAKVEWTERASEKIRAGEYRYISPEFVLEYKDKESGKPVGATLLAVALTNRPFLEGMAPVELMEGKQATTFNEQSEVEETSTLSIGGANVNLDIIREVLGLAEDVEVTDEQIAEAVEKLHTQNKELQTTNTELAETIKASEVRTEGTVRLSEEEFASLKEDAKAGKEASVKLREMIADEAVGTALSERKIAPKQKDWAKKYALNDPDGFAEFVENATEIISFDEIGSGDAGETNVDEVRSFIKEKTDGGVSLAKAQQMALAEFGAEAFAQYRVAQ